MMNGSRSPSSDRLNIAIPGISRGGRGGRGGRGVRGGPGGHNLGRREGSLNLHAAPAPPPPPVVVHHAASMLDLPGPQAPPISTRERVGSAPARARFTEIPERKLRSHRSRVDSCDSTVEPRQSLVQARPMIAASTSTASNVEVLFPPPARPRRNTRPQTADPNVLPSTSGETKKK